MNWGHLNPASLVIGDRQWILPASVLLVAGLLLALWLNRSRLRSTPLGPMLRIAGWTILCGCLLNPLWSSSRPRSGANVIAVVADTSRSMLVQGDGKKTRAELIQAALAAGEKTDPVGWLSRLNQDFELRRYLVSDRLQQTDRLEQLEFNGTASDLNQALQQLRQRFEGQPLAGVILLTDGNATDQSDSVPDLTGLAPVYPVLLNDDETLPDAATGHHSVTQTAFDDAPVTIQVQPAVENFPEGQISVTLADATGVPIETQTRPVQDPTPLRFRHRPSEGGTVFYQLKVGLKDGSGNTVENEATAVNNTELIAVQRNTMPSRILYVSGRPNWDFKFLHRAVESDPQLQMAALIRIARKEAKFDFRGRDGERANSLFRGFDKSDAEMVEEYDEPVLVRLYTMDDKELREGFPQSPEDLFCYDGLVIDDLEADFFQADQMKLIHDFVSRRGGGLLMMAGQESFRQGGFDRTPIGETLPIDLSREVPFPGTAVRLQLTRDGWLQPWVRLRDEEGEEEQRLLEMPEFVTLNPPGFVRPGAIVMSEVMDEQENRWPALIVQRFGKGRTAALCVGDLWRWRLQQGRLELEGRITEPQQKLTDAASAPGGLPQEDLSDHARACRQMMRWLVSDVPRQLDLSVRPDPQSGSGEFVLRAMVRGPDFEPRENADVKFRVTSPDGQKFELSGEPSDSEAGVFEAGVTTTVPGAWVAQVDAVVSDEADAKPLSASTGWAWQPDQKEMASVRINRDYLEEIAKSTGGRTISLEDLESFAASLPQASAPLTEIWSWPVWHSWIVFVIALACLLTDWSLRRRSGLP